MVYLQQIQINFDFHLSLTTNFIEHAINEVDKHVYFIHVLERQIIINIVILVSESFVLFIQFVSCNMHVFLRISLLQQIQINFDFHLSLTNGLLTTNTDQL
jgi:hypothetical protein